MMVRNLLSKALGCAALLLAAPVIGQTVKLASPDGNVNMSGEIEAFDGAFYTLSTSLGTFRVNANDVDCIGDSCPPLTMAGDFTVSGAVNLTQSLFPALLKSYAQSTKTPLTETTDGKVALFQLDEPGQEDARSVNLIPSSSQQGLTDFLLGRSQMALSTRPVSKEELSNYSATGLEALEEHILSVEGLVIVTPSDNILPSISVSDIAEVFSGGYTNWSQLGGPDAPITLYAREPGSDLSDVFNDLVLRPHNRTLSDTARVVTSDAALVRTVAADPFGIGFTSFSQIADSRALPIVGQCGLVMTPTEFNIKTEDYPLAHRLYAYKSRIEAPNLLDDLLAHMRGDEATLSATTGLTSQSLIRGAVDQQGMRFASAIRSDRLDDALPLLRQMVTEMVGSERLSATLRFKTGSNILDSRAKADIARVADTLMERTATGAKKILRIMSFTDALGDPELNRELSLRRANQVRDLLLTEHPELSDRVELRPMGFGDVSPIACDESSVGRRINRRVELWVSTVPL